MPTKIHSTSSTGTRTNDSDVSTLAKAATPLKTKPNEPTSTNTGQIQPSKWKCDVWHRVNLEMEVKHRSGSQMSLMDCKAIQMKMAEKNAERMRQKQIRLEMGKLNEICDMMQRLKISNLEKSVKKLERNSLQKEEKIVRVR